MLWYGYIYYFLFNALVFLLVLFLLRLFSLFSLYRTTTTIFISKLFITNTLFSFLLIFLVLNATLDFYQYTIFLSDTSLNIDISILSLFTNNDFFTTTSLSLNLIEVYYYPFVYVFMLITILSILFCLSYNKDELMSFMFYCQLILAAGYTIFFTDSIILFFLAYEMLLVPSFFILYKFAKTRRCVEAAYLMFFWTQFGALFLLFGLLYLFMVCNSSKFSIISYYYLSSFEVNFLFFCW
jgi:formate hydrogenlyase subunit 3/multisubunit Na+/H+ antiporter MnhD subunit